MSSSLRRPAWDRISASDSSRMKFTASATVMRPITRRSESITGADTRS